jgi:hypothetical protein
MIIHIGIIGIALSQYAEKTEGENYRDEIEAYKQLERRYPLIFLCDFDNYEICKGSLFAITTDLQKFAKSERLSRYYITDASSMRTLNDL